MLSGIDLAILEGSVAIISGANGSGKSTLLRIIATLSKPSSGKVEVFGHDTQSHGETVRAMTGAMMHSPMLYSDLTVHENLTLFAQLCRLNDINSRIESVSRRLGIIELLNDSVRQLSHGFQKRVALARSIMHAPPLLLLDEPETGLDTVGLDALQEIVGEWRTSGRSAIIATHRPELLETTPDMHLRLDAGRVQQTHPQSA